MPGLCLLDIGGTLYIDHKITFVARLRDKCNDFVLRSIKFLHVSQHAQINDNFCMVL